jgi:hypothetical protein
MTYEFTAHAKTVIIERGISIEMVERVLNLHCRLILATHDPRSSTPDTHTLSLRAKRSNLSSDYCEIVLTRMA